MATHDIDWFLERLEGVEGDSGQWTAWCPCHDDMGSSLKGLSVSQNGKRILIKCHSAHCGATLPEVLAVLKSGETSYNGNGSHADDEEVHITVKKKQTKREPKGTKASGMAWWVEKTGVTEKIWAGLGCEEYNDGVMFTFGDAGIVKIRKPPKDIIWTPKGADAPPLWPMPDAELPEDVWITEGESDCGVASAAGHYAFAVTKGAGTDLPFNWADEMYVRGVRRMTICGDIDKSGQEFRRTLEKQVIDAGMACRTVHLELVLDPFTGETDLNNLWRSCEYDVKRFNALVEECTQDVDLRYPILTYDALEEWAETEVDWILEDLISPGDKVLISGPQKSYKTWIMLDLARSLVTGENFLKRAEWKPRREVKCLIVQEEGSKSAWAKRLRRLQLTGEERQRLLSLHRSGIRFTDSSTIDTVIAVCRQEEIDVLFLDPLQRMMPGINENDSSETGVVWDEVFRIQFALPHLVVVVLHHANKTERLTWESVRGSSRHAGEVDLGIFCQKHPIEDNTVRISYDGRDIPNYLGTGESFEAKIKISADDDPEPHFEIDATEISVTVNVNPTHAEGTKNRDQVLTAVAEGHTTKGKIMEATGLSDSTVRKHLKQLTEDGLIIENDHGEGRSKTYTIADGEESTDADA